MGVAAPWYRSRLFWFGLPGFLFLCWMWAGYQTSLVHVGWNVPAGNYSVGWGGGQISLSFTDRMNMPTIGGVVPGFAVNRMPIEPDDGQSFFPPAVFVTEDWPGIAFAIWLFLAVYFAGWLGGMVLLQRKKRKWLTELRGIAAATPPGK